MNSNKGLQSVADIVDELRQPQKERPDLRDQFAMVALVGVMVTNAAHYSNRFEDADAKVCYQIADAMLEARRRLAPELQS